MRKPEYYCAVFALIHNEKWEVLTIKRKNTGFMDGYFGLPAGHIEGKELPIVAMQREILEEVGLHVEFENLQLIHIAYRIQEDRMAIDFYFRVAHFHGTPRNAEPEKSEGISWIDWKNEKKMQFRETLSNIDRGEFYSEVDFRAY